MRGEINTGTKGSTSSWSTPGSFGGLAERVYFSIIQREGECPGILGGLACVLGARDGQNAVLLDQPPQGYLAWTLVVAGPDFAQQLDQASQDREVPAAEVPGVAPPPGRPGGCGVLARKRTGGQ